MVFIDVSSGEIAITIMLSAAQSHQEALRVRSIRPTYERHRQRFSKSRKGFEGKTESTVWGGGYPMFHYLTQTRLFYYRFVAA